jgi:hypothetical protein
MVTATRQQNRFLSRPYSQRPGFAPAVVALVVGWLLVIGCFIAAAAHYSAYSIFGYFEFLVAFGLAAFTTLMTFALIHESKMTQELVLDDESITLSTYDHNNATTISNTMDFRDIIRAEHYKAQDTNAVVLRGMTSTMEIPTWCFDHATDLTLVEALLEHNIQVRGIPHDIEVELQHQH